MSKKKNRGAPLFPTRSDGGQLPLVRRDGEIRQAKGQEPEAVVAKKDGDEAGVERKKLLQEFAEALQKVPERQALEGSFRKAHPKLHFRLWSEFGTYQQALVSLAKLELGPYYTRHQALERLATLVQEGVGVTLQKLVTTEPRLASLILRECGSMDDAFEELGLDPDVASRDRRWPREKLFEAALELYKEGGKLDGEDFATLPDPVFADACELEFHTPTRFQEGWSQWLGALASFYVTFGRGQIGRFLARDLDCSSRGTKGTLLSGLSRVSKVWSLPVSSELYMVTSLGRLLPYELGEAPLLLQRQEPVQGGKVSGLKRGEKAVGLFDFGRQDGFLALATRQGRVKVIHRSEYRRLTTSGTVAMRLTQTDRVTAAGWLSEDFQGWAVLTSASRAAGFDREAIPPSNRRTMGLVRLRFDDPAKDEPVCVVEIGEEHDVVALNRSGTLLRIASDEIPRRKGTSLGRRIWRTPLVGAISCKEDQRLALASKRGRLLCFWVSQVPGRHALRKGVRGIRLESDDTAEAITVITP